MSNNGVVNVLILTLMGLHLLLTVVLLFQLGYLFCEENSLLFPASCNDPMVFSFDL